MRDSESRIKAMSLVHEHIYRKDLSSVDFREYAEVLVSHLRSFYSREDFQLEVVLGIDPVRMDIDRAIPCGLLINELLSNSMKHAFPEREHGRVTVSMKEAADRVVLTVADDGVGLSGKDPAQGGTLGQPLIRSLVRQLAGTVDMCDRDGLHCTIVFPRERKGDRHGP
jgi:two-component sensor histidine kinase